MDAPKSVCAVAARVLEAAGFECSYLRAGSRGQAARKRVLLLGRNYIIGSGFAFEKREV
jgi:hypothetical protein